MLWRVGEHRPQPEHPAELLDLGGVLSIPPVPDEGRDAVGGEPRIVEARLHVGETREHHAAEDGTPMHRLLLAELAKHRIRIRDQRRELRVVGDAHRISARAQRDSARRLASGSLYASIPPWTYPFSSTTPVNTITLYERSAHSSPPALRGRRAARRLRTGHPVLVRDGRIRAGSPVTLMEQAYHVLGSPRSGFPPGSRRAECIVLRSGSMEASRTTPHVDGGRSLHHAGERPYDGSMWRKRFGRTQCPPAAGNGWVSAGAPGR